MKLKHTCAALALAFAPLLALGQPQTLHQVAQQALVSNPEVLARWHAFEAAGHERAASAGGYLPRLDLTAGAGRDDIRDPLKTNDLSRNASSLTLTQMLWDGALTYNDVRRLDHTRMARLYELYDVSETVVLDVVRSYADVLRYRKLVELAEENYVRHQAVFMQIQKKTQAGVSRRVDLEQIAGRLALAESNLLQETANLHDVSARFQRLVGVVPSPAMQPLALLDKDLPPTMAQALGTALRAHPSLQASVENVRANEKAARLRRATYQPRVDLRMRSDNGSNLNGLPGSSSNKALEVQLSWNLFNGFSDVSRVRQQADLINVARDQRDKACRDVRQTLSIAYNDTTKLTEQLAYLDQHQLSIEKARDAYRKQFDIGQRSLLDLLDSENELFQSRRSYANAEFDRLFAFARAHAGMGTLYQALGLARRQPASLPAVADKNDGENIASNCPVEAPPVYTIDKEKLNARAREYVFESASAPAPAPATLLTPALMPAPAAPAVVAPKQDAAPARPARKARTPARTAPAPDQFKLSEES
ncbi:TolC family outer membrane protein [Massilia sp. PAMC28688]|uniref:TolC family outer membrane protein n=1 Tax=Massilia sp. PAMC28688 TaxID=2861283 RepID=UPI001E512920|nr:TolC family outer membrane protein [Massilia sp. PAMC28688]